MLEISRHFQPRRESIANTSPFKLVEKRPPASEDAPDTGKLLHDFEEKERVFLLDQAPDKPNGERTIAVGPLMCIRRNREVDDVGWRGTGQKLVCLRERRVVPGHVNDAIDVPTGPAL